MAKKRNSKGALAVAQKALQVANAVSKTKKKKANRGGQSAAMAGGGMSRADPRNRVGASTAVALACYEAALMRPFSEAALGARVPDSYSFPSEVRHAKLVYTLASAAGRVDAAIFPHPLYTVISGVGTLSGGTITPDVVAGLTQTGIVSQSVLSGVFGNYRVVGGGVRIKWSQSYNSATGRIFVAIQPSPANVAYFSRTGATRAGIYESMDIPDDGTGIPTSIITLPYSMEVPASELIGNGIEIPFRVSSAAFSEWRETSTGGTGPALITANGTAVEEAFGENFVACDGFSSILIAGTNLPTGAACLDIEVILHMEGTPAIGTGASTGGVLAGASNSPVVNVTGMFNALAKQNNVPFASKISSIAVKGVSTGLKMVNTVGRMARVLGFANP